MSEPATTTVSVGMGIVALVSLIFAQISGNELTRVIACAFFASYFAASSFEGTVLHKFVFFIKWGVVGLIISSPSCALISKITGYPQEAWPGFVTFVGTIFLTMFRDEYPKLLRRILNGYIEKIIRDENIRGGDKK